MLLLLWAVHAHNSNPWHGDPKAAAIKSVDGSSDDPVQRAKQRRRKVRLVMDAPQWRAHWKLAILWAIGQAIIITGLATKVWDGCRVGVRLPRSGTFLTI